MNKKDPKLSNQDITTNLNIYQKLQQVQRKVGQLEKDQLNKFQNYKYVAEYDILRTLKPLLNEQNLVLTFSDEINLTSETIISSFFQSEKLEKEWVVRYLKKMTLTNADNPSEQLNYNFWAPGQNTDIAKAKGSAETYAIKYFLMKFFLIPTSDNLDPDNEDSETAEEKEKVNKPLTIKKSSTTKKDFTTPTTTTITNIIEKLDKNKNKYLLLETDNLDNNVFVFDYKVEVIRWKELTKGKTYQFNLEENNNNLLTLLDFKEIN